MIRPLTAIFRYRDLGPNESNLGMTIEKHRYYSTQINYIVGSGAPNNALIIRNALDMIKSDLQKWDMASNKNDHAVQELLALAVGSIGEFSAPYGPWNYKSVRRLEEIKGALQ